MIVVTLGKRTYSTIAKFSLPPMDFLQQAGVLTLPLL